MIQTEQQIKISYRDCDYYKRLRPSAMLAMFSELAGEHLTSLGLPHDKLWDEGYVFVLTKLAVEIDRHPKFPETLTLKTEANSVQGAQFVRNFTLTGADGKVAVRCTTYWVLANPETRNILRPRNFPYEIPTDDSMGFVLPVDKLPDNFRLLLGGEYPVVYSDLDYNRHMSNVRYADLVIDIFPPEELDRPLRSFWIRYHREVSAEEMINLYTDETPDTIAVRGMYPDEETQIFDAKFTFVSEEE